MLGSQLVNHTSHDFGLGSGGGRDGEKQVESGSSSSYQHKGMLQSKGGLTDDLISDLR